MTNKATLSLTTTCQTLSGGTDAVQGIGQDDLFTCGLTSGGFDFNIGDIISITATNVDTGYQTLMGGGNVSGITPTYVFTNNQQTYALNSFNVYFCGINQPTQWNDPNGTGNGYVALQDFYGTKQELIAAASFQGRIAFFSRFCTQIWQVSPDPSQWQRLQVLQNTGTVAALSVQSLSDLDVLYLSDTGIRSLRSREATLNAFVDDLGSPIDTLVTASNGSNSGACAVVEPKTGRYWCCIAGVIYVFSRFLANQISAWSTYLPTYQKALTVTGGTYTVVIGKQYYWEKGSNDVSITDGTTTWTKSGYVTPAATSVSITTTGGASLGHFYDAVAFTPTQFLIQDGLVYCRDANNFFLYGSVYDYSQGVAETTWLDLNNPANLKKAVGLDAAFKGNLGFAIGMNPAIDKFQSVYSGTEPTFLKGGIPYSADGYHVKFQVTTQDNQAATLSSLVFAYKTSVEKEDGH